MTTEAKGTYIGVRFKPSTLEQIERLQESLELVKPVPRNKLHCTMLYCLHHVEGLSALGKVDWRSDAQVFDLDVWESSTGLPCLVLTFESKDLQKRHKELLDQGGKHTFPEFAPHVTLSYDISDWSPQERKAAKDWVIAFDDYSPILIGSEYYEDLDLNWSASTK